MAEVKSEAEKEAEEDRKKEMEYKATADVERAFHLVSTARQLVDYPKLNHLANSFTRELQAMELKQEDLDKKEDEERAKKLAERETKRAKEAQKEAEAEHASTTKSKKEEWK